MSENIQEYLTGSVQTDDNETNVRGSKPTNAICFVLQCGKRVAFQYSHLYYCDWHGDTLRCYFTDHVVTLRGKSLEKRFLDINERKRQKVQERDETQAAAQGLTDYVSSITITPREQ